MQIHGHRLNLAAAGEHLSLERVAIYVAYLLSMHSSMQHNESNPNAGYLII